MIVGQLIGMLIPDGTNAFFSSLSRQFQRQLADHKYGLIVMDSDGSIARERENLDLLISMNVAGLVFISVGDSGDAFIRLDAYRHPILALDREVPLENADFVLVDNGAGVRFAVEYLASLGHERIACIGGASNTEPGRERAGSFRSSCEAMGLAVVEDLMFGGDFMFGSGTSAADKILAMPRESWPSAVFAGNDLMALGAMQRLQERGVRIPEDISFVGFDDIELSTWVFPKLTTVSQDTMEIARVGADLLMSRVKASGVERAPSVNSRVGTVTPKLIKRDSCRRVH